MYSFKPSRRKNKKYDAYKNNVYLVSFGQKGYSQFLDRTPLKLYSHLDNRDKEKRRLYYARHGKDAKFESAKWFSHRYLW